MRQSATLIRALFIVTTLVVFTNSSVSTAQEVGEGLDISTFKPAASANSVFQTWTPTTKKHLKWSLGGYVSYAHKMVTRTWSESPGSDVTETAYPVKFRITADLFAGIGLWDWLEVGLGVPVIAYQQGEGAIPDGSLAPAGLGDPRLELKARVYKGKLLHAALGVLTSFPVGHYLSNGTDFMGSTFLTVEPRVIAGLDLGRWMVAVNGGFIMRRSAYLGTFEEIEQSHGITAAAGATYDLIPFDDVNGLQIAFEAVSEIGVDFEPAVIPVEARVGAKYRPVEDVVLLAGAGGGMSTAVGTPAFRVFVGAMWDKLPPNCEAGPEDFDGFQDDDKCIDPDNDLDTIDDENDKCPNVSEDLDGFEDDDGCPEMDNDGDGLPDPMDACPMMREDVDDFEDNDGCPEEGPGKATVTITDTQLLISSKIYFDYNKANIKTVSFPILDAIAEAMLKNPHIKTIRVEGHSDNEGTEDYNMKLSEERAQAVVEYLVGKNIDKGRLTYKGYGFTRPKATNTLEEGRAINRRVEFSILKKE